MPRFLLNHPLGFVALVGCSFASLIGCGDSAAGPSQRPEAAISPDASAAGSAGAPADEVPSGLLIAGVAARQPAACELRAEAGGPNRQRGTFDRALAPAYTAGLRVENGFSERVQLRSVNVQLQSAQGEPLSDAFTFSVSGLLDAGNDAGGAAQGLVFAGLVPPTLTAALPLGAIVVELRLLGETASGVELASPPLAFPLDVCEGCLISYPAFARDPDAAGADYQCLAGVDAAARTPPDQLPCELGIDDPVPCTLCSNSLEICASPAKNPSKSP
jgi:hypothetical protein